MIDPEPPNYTRIRYYAQKHVQRFRHRVEQTDDSLMCQACGGEGGETNRVVELMPGYLDGPWEHCDWCRGTGLVTRWLRGVWLRYKADLKRGEA
ncbi:hypothetical protein LCGC14_0552290 [marine sediment metagenome]|uniref:Uncharacterized protein n=1 Tax=marine sediment metagenome TaxID=412755 RepID=A0A0F9UAW6_9ZZZZ